MASGAVMDTACSRLGSNVVSVYSFVPGRVGGGKDSMAQVTAPPLQLHVDVIMAQNRSSMNRSYCFNEKSTQLTMDRKLRNRIRQSEDFEMIQSRDS